MHAPRGALVAVGAALACAAAGGPAWPEPGLRFDPPVVLDGGLGGEPSVTFDPSGNGAVYVVAPQKLPALVGSVRDESRSPRGVTIWVSRDNGRTFPAWANIGSGLGGGDADVVVTDDHSVYVADLEGAASSICRSTDFGRSFADAAAVDGGCRDVTTNHSGPAADRQWLAAFQDEALYLTYSDLALAAPVIYRSVDQGATFTPCGDLLGSGPARDNVLPLVAYTRVAKPVVDQRDGSLYVLLTQPDRARAAAEPHEVAPAGNLYVAVSHEGCTGSTSFATYPVYTDAGAELAKTFDVLAMDAGGTLYAVGAGTLREGQATDDVYLFTSKDRGVTWSAPQRVNAPDLTANVLPALAAGRDGQVAVGWYGTSDSPDETTPTNRWRFYVAESSNGGRSWRQTAVTDDYVHYGDICVIGVACGGNRNLLDFASLAYDPGTGRLLAVFGADPENRPDLGGPDNGRARAYVAREAGPGSSRGRGVGRRPPSDP